ncbi:MAG: hypothetical protein IJA87_10040 [Clostridia bacterium]|nr:hypothetical protein [Clostridia bacterium]
MKKTKKTIAFLLVMMLCLVCFSACSDNGADVTEESGVGIEDVEDAEIGKGKVTLANMMGKDALELLARPVGTEDWSSSILSDDSLRAGVAVEFTYVKNDTNVFDLRFVFEDGTTQDFTNIDFAKAQSTIYLGVE